MISRIKNVDSDDLVKVRVILSTYESHCAEFYFKQIFDLIPERIRPECRRTYKAYDGINNLV